MRSLFPELFFLAALASLLPACSGWLEEPVRPTPVLLPRPSETMHEFVPGVHRYLDSGDRLSFATHAPTPSPTSRPTRDALRSAPARVPATAVPDSEPPGMVWEGETLSCRDRYRLMLIEYDGRTPFGAEAAWSLSRDLEGLRPGCLDEGWGPVFDTGVVCQSGSIAGIRISPELTRRLNAISHPTALPTGRDRRGNILVHFGRLPLTDRPGCWYYNSARQVWAWAALGGDSEVDRPRFPVCNRLLREMVEAVAVSEEGFGPVHVVRALDEVRAQRPVECGSSLWNIFPAFSSHEDCGAAGGTGVNADGVLVIAWHPDHLPADGSVCWTQAPGSGSWEFSYPREAE